MYTHTKKIMFSETIQKHDIDPGNILVTQDEASVYIMIQRMEVYVNMCIENKAERKYVMMTLFAHHCRFSVPSFERIH